MVYGGEPEAAISPIPIAGKLETGDLVDCPTRADRGLIVHHLVSDPAENRDGDQG
jgi:hypothetical protein